MIANYEIDPDDFYFAATLTAPQVPALPVDVNRRNLVRIFIFVLETKRSGFSSQAIWSGHKIVECWTTWVFKSVFKSERNVTHEGGFVLWTQTTRARNVQKVPLGTQRPGGTVQFHKCGGKCMRYNYYEHERIGLPAGVIGFSKNAGRSE